MIQHSKAASGLLVVFGAPFAAAGLCLIYAQTRSFQASRSTDALAAIIFGSAFALFGFALMFAAIYGYRRAQQQSAVEQANPSSPWVWRSDWAVQRAESRNKKREITLWCFCLLWSLIAIPVALGIVPKVDTLRDPRLFVPLAFLVAGAVLLGFAVRATLAHHRYGHTYFEFNSLPFSPGGHVRGSIHVKLDARAEHGVDLRLACIRKTATGSGKNRTIVQTILWQADANVPAGALSVGPLGAIVPVDFSLPPEACVTDQSDYNDQVLWTLHAKADVPGVNYTDDFEVPVFGTALSPRVAPNSSSVDSSFATGFVFTGSGDGDTSGPVSAPLHPKVSVSTQSGATEFYFRPFRNPAHDLLLFIFTVVWTGIVYFLFHSRAPWFFAVIFGLFDFLLIIGVFQSVVASHGIFVGNGEIAWQRKILGLGRLRRMPVSELEAVVTVGSTQQSGSSLTAVYAIQLRAKDGRKIKLVDEIDNRQEARWIVAQMETLSGLKLDTRVEMQSRFGPPPQPMRPSAAGSLPSSLWSVAQVPAGRRAQSSSWGALILFGAFVAAMIATQAARFSAISHTHAARLAFASSRGTVPIPRRIFKSPLTDADVARIVALPAQDQAEELLERALGHDVRALELLNRQLPTWLGKIRMTPRLTQLDERARFCGDLRLRYADANLYVTLNGLPQNDASVSALIEHARTDANYRPTALYALGILGGDGIAYGRAHAALLDYARNSKDETARLWAVEGLQFMRKDEALDDLFESFTHDPSDAVRQRAGCNLSDCGLFTRAQRMRMVPKILALASDPATNARMKAWSFLMLHEITGQNLSSDANAWSAWYRQHGVEKEAELQRQDWWRVRGEA